MFCVADVTPRRRSGKHLFRWNRTQETRNVSAVAFLPTLPQPLSNPTIPTGRHLLSAAGARSLPASGLVRPGPPCNVNLGSSGFWQKLHTQKRKEKRPQKKNNLRLILIILQFFYLFIFFNRYFELVFQLLVESALPFITISPPPPRQSYAHVWRTRRCLPAERDLHLREMRLRKRVQVPTF